MTEIDAFGGSRQQELLAVMTALGAEHHFHELDSALGQHSAGHDDELWHVLSGVVREWSADTTRGR
jgi:hypothetical protein